MTPEQLVDRYARVAAKAVRAPPPRPGSDPWMHRVDMDGVEFYLLVSGRRRGDGLLGVRVPF